MRKTIPLRETLTPYIFDEMIENYPLTAVDGREYKQELKYFSVPSDFDFIQFRFDCEDSDINPHEAYIVWSYLMAQMCSEHGYYCENTKALMFKMSTALGLSDEQIKAIVEALIDTGYLYEFSGRFTNIPAVRTFECVQSTRISNRTRKKPAKTDENAVVSEERPDIPTSTEAQEEAPEPDMGEEELKFFQEQEKEMEDIEKKDTIWF